ncbi:MAG: MFS transporter [Candidatus Saccharibacteria bacterium]|nr:MFS transporter [Candidatus Saccharibacteria bacterium]
MKKAKRLFIVLIGVVLSLSGVIFSVLSVGNVSAVSASDIMKKWAYTNAYDCISAKTIFKPTITPDDISHSYYPIWYDAAQTENLYIPSYGYNGTDSGSTTNPNKNGCYQVIEYMTSHGTPSVKTYQTAPAPSTLTDRENYIVDMFGYEKGVANDFGTFTISATKTRTMTVDADVALGDFVPDDWDTNPAPEQVETPGISISPGSGQNTIHWERVGDNPTYGMKVSFVNDSAGKSMLRIWIDTPTKSYYDGFSFVSQDCSDALLSRDIPIDGVVSNLSDVASWFDSQLANKNLYYTCVEKYKIINPIGLSLGWGTITEKVNYQFASGGYQVVQSSSTNTYTHPTDSTKKKTAAENFVKKSLGVTSYDRKLSATERFSLYSYYVTEAAKEHAVGNSTTYFDCNPTSTTNLTEVPLYLSSTGKIENCWANFNGASLSTIWVTAPNADATKVIQFSLATVITWMKNNKGLVNLNELDGYDSLVGSLGELPDPSDPGGGGGGNTGGGTTHEQKEACFREAGSLGWIVCPMIFGMDEFIQGIYEKHIEPLLKPDKAIISNLGDSSSALHTSWGYFRDFTNVIFVGALLIIIFSQVTGFGIDNFGIKRMLPKLIIAAVLVNLSFVICALVIDASNIVGRGIYNLMTTLGDSITPPDSLGASGTTGSYAAVIIEALIVGLTGAGAAAAFMTQGWLIILPILLLALSIVISVLFLFITLGVRQAAIIVFIILAPLGLVMYILPNTHSLFKKWLSIFSALLFVYPIASLLIGAGYFVARMLLFSGSDNIMMYLVAGLVSVAPYFFIPSIVSNSMKGLGNIGAKLQGLGKSASGSATRAINQGVRGSQRYQNAANRRLNARQASFQNSQLKKYAKRKSGIRGYLPGGRVRDEFGHYEMDEAKIDALGTRPTSGLFKNARANANAAKLRDIANASAAIAGNDVGLARSKASMAMSNLRPEALRGAEADYAEAETQKMIKAQESLIESNMKSANLDENAIGNQLESALQNAATDPNRLAAYANVLNKTKEGQRVLRRVLRETSMNGTMAGNNQQAIARHITNNPGNLKEKDPDTLKWAAEAQHTQSHVDYGGFLHGSTGDLSNDAFKNLDSQVLASYANNAETLRTSPSSSLSAEQKVQLNQSTDAARAALQSYFAGNDNFEQDRLDHIVRMAGYSDMNEARQKLDGTYITPDGNGGFKIQHGGGQTS